MTRLLNTSSRPTSTMFGVFSFLLLIVWPYSSSWLSAQQEVDQKIQQHLESGEFPKAISLAQGLETVAADRWMGRIAMQQVNSGAYSGGYTSAGQITSDEVRSRTLGSLFDQGNQGNQPGARGGVTEQDFEPLMELIKTTIAPDDWDDTNGDGTIQAYPSGVYVDASGTLQRIQRDDGSLKRLRDQFNPNESSLPNSNLRMVSLPRLERMAQLRAAQGLPLDDEVLNLAGIYELKYLFVYPQSGDVVIAGPAGPWVKDEDGRAINAKTGKPVLQLVDLVVCLRNAWDNHGKFGCAITPRKQNLAETQAFLATSKLKGKAWRKELRQVLGKQDVEVFGIPAGSHAGKILVEADYRMKLVGMGLEPSIPEIPSYLERVQLKPDGTLDGMTVARWWFTLNYDSVTTDEDRLSFKFDGSGVKVLSENEMVSQQGDRIHTGKSAGPTREFAKDFTRHFPKMADQYPIYAQLKNIFDLALISSLIKNEGLAEQAGWELTYFGSPDLHSRDYSLRFELPTEAIANQVESVMNHREIRQRKAGKTLIHTLVGVSGGISCDLNRVTKKKDIEIDLTGSTSNRALDAKPMVPVDSWWWD